MVDRILKWQRDFYGAGISATVLGFMNHSIMSAIIGFISYFVVAATMKIIFRS